jgi:RNA 2',3'-cyclic 3'-phosphodiesterase
MCPDIRAFVAMEIKDKSILDLIGHYQSELNDSIGPLKIVDRSLIHITLRFLGNITEDIAKEIYSFIDSEINQQFFSETESKIQGTLKGTGHFNKRVFFIKIEGIKELLREINKKIELKLQDFDTIKEETKKFNPHLTIARSKNRKYQRNSNSSKPNLEEFSELMNKYSNFLFGAFDVNRVVLKKSILTPKGPIYSNLEY